MGIPDSVDIANVIADLAAGLKLDPVGYDDCCWLCDLHDPSGVHVGYGIGLTAREAAAYAWIDTWDLAPLLACVINGTTPAEPDNRWRFELYPPGSWERVFASAA